MERSNSPERETSEQITVAEREDAFVFRAATARALQGLYEQFEQSGIRFTYSLGGKENFLEAYKNQGDDLDALDREMHLGMLVDEYRQEADW